MHMTSCTFFVCSLFSARSLSFFLSLLHDRFSFEELKTENGCSVSMPCAISTLSFDVAILSKTCPPRVCPDGCQPQRIHSLWNWITHPDWRLHTVNTCALKAIFSSSVLSKVAVQLLLRAIVCVWMNRWIKLFWNHVYCRCVIFLLDYPGCSQFSVPCNYQVAIDPVLNWLEFAAHLFQCSFKWSGGCKDHLY